jgi:hypothetical protein
MAIDYVSKINTFIQLLSAHNTTTATPDLSASLTTRIQTITAAEPDLIGSRHGFFPLIMVELANANEEETQIGDFTNRRKIKDVTFNVWGFYKKEGISKNHSQQLTDFYQMASNIESVLKRESSLSGTALLVSPVSTSFTERRENNLIKVLKIETSVRYFYS